MQRETSSAKCGKELIDVGHLGKVALVEIFPSVNSLAYEDGYPLVNRLLPQILTARTHTSTTRSLAGNVIQADGSTKESNASNLPSVVTLPLLLKYANAPFLDRK